MIKNEATAERTRINLNKNTTRKDFKLNSNARERLRKF